MASTHYAGAYKRLFPGILSSNTLITVYTLHLLNKKPCMYGKEIVDGISDQLSGIWTPSHGLVYPLLRRLESLELIKGEWEGSGNKKTRRFYKITDKGKEALNQETLKIKPMFEQSRQMIDYAMQDLYALN